MTDEVDEIDELEAHLRVKWAAELDHRPTLDDEALAVAKKLMNTSNVQRLAKSKPDGRAFRYRPDRIQRVEVYFVPPGNRVLHYLHSGWRIEVLLNHQRRPFRRELTENDAAIMIADLRKASYDVRLVVTEAMRVAGVTAEPQRRAQISGHRPSLPSAHQQPSKSREMLRRLASFRG